jgi:alanyl-tRNA synthetase
MKKNNGFTPVGETTDGKTVVDGIWYLFETHGLPLDIIFSICQERKMIPDWILLYKQMRFAGMEHDRVISKIEEAINDSFGKEFCGVVISRLNEIFQFKDTK